MLFQLILMLWIGLPLPAHADAPVRRIDYLYVDANEGTASGGHVAIRFDDEVFHFQHAQPGLLRLTVEGFDHFRFEYGRRENRTIRSHAIEVSDDTFCRLEAGFRHYLLTQNEHFERTRALDDDIHLLESLEQIRDGGDGRAASVAPLTMELPALGFFLADVWHPDRDGLEASGSPSLAVLQRQIDAAFGPDYVANKRSAIRDALRDLEPGVSANEIAEEDGFLPAPYAYARRYTDLLTNLAALEVLRRGLPVRPIAMNTDRSPAFRLTPDDVKKLVTFRQDLLANMCRLIGSQRPDWGQALLVGIARLQALDNSMATGYLTVLDRFPQQDSLPEPHGAGSESTAGLLAPIRSEFAAARSALTGGDTLDERRYGRLELAASRLTEVEAAWREDRRVRSLALPAVPERSALAELPMPALGRSVIQRHLALIRAQRERWTNRMMALYRYDLLANNCVSKIFGLIDRILTAKPDGPDAKPAPMFDLRTESERRLGGYIAEDDWSRIPFLSFRAVGARYRVVATDVWESYRRQRIRQEYAREMPILVDVRESNVLSSAIYRTNADDAPFLFFTDDPVWIRPLLGGFNVAFGVVQTLGGVFSLPWDAGEGLGRSLRGLAVSLPELFFINIRKGSFPHLSEGIRAHDER